MNGPVQGTAADVLKIVMRDCVPLLRFYGAHLDKQVHDEVTGWARPENVAEFCGELQKLMNSVTVKGLPLEAEGGY